MIVHRSQPWVQHVVEIAPQLLRVDGREVPAPLDELSCAGSASAERSQFHHFHSVTRQDESLAPDHAVEDLPAMVAQASNRHRVLGANVSRWGVND